MGSKNQKSSADQTSSSGSNSNSQSDTNSLAASNSTSDSTASSLNNSTANSLSNSATGSTANSSLTTAANDPGLLAAYRSLLSGAQQTTSNPLQLYNGQLVAGLTPDQLAGISRIGSASSLATPYLTSAGDFATASAQAPTQASLAQFYSPYQKDVVDSTRALLNTQDAEQQSQLMGNAAAAGAYGGDRSAVLQAQLARSQALANGSTLANLQNSGYNTALGEFNTSNSNKAAAGYELGNIGTSLANTALTGGQALLGAGGLEQQVAQQNLNVPYEQYLQAQQYPYQNLNFLASILPGILQGTGQTTTGSNLGSTFGTNTGLSTGTNAGTSTGSNTGSTYGVNLGSATGNNSSTGYSTTSGTNTQPGPSMISQGLGLAAAAAPFIVPFLKDGGRARLASGGGSMSNFLIPAGGSDVLDYGQSYVPTASPPPGNPLPLSAGAGLEQGSMASALPSAPPLLTGGANAPSMASAPALMSSQAPTLMGAPAMNTPSITSAAQSASPQSASQGQSASGLASSLSTLGDAAGMAGNYLGLNPTYTGTQAPFAEGLFGNAAGYGGLFGSAAPTVAAADIAPASFDLASMLPDLASLASGGRAKLADGGADDEFASILDSLYPTPKVQPPKTDGAMSLADTPPAWRDQATHYAPPTETEPDILTSGQPSDAAAPDANASGSLASPTWDDGTPVSKDAPKPASMSDWGTPHEQRIIQQAYQPKPDWRRALLTAGASMMAGTSPFALTNIGRGIQAGAEQYYGQEDKDNHPEIDHSGPTSMVRYADGTVVDTGIPTEAAMNAKASNDYRVANAAQISADRKAAIEERANAAAAEVARQKQADADRAADRKLQLDIGRQNAGGTWSYAGVDPKSQLPVLLNNRTGETKFGTAPIAAKPAPAPAAGGVSLSPDAIKQIAGQYRAGDHTALTSLGYGSQGATNRALVRNEIASQSAAAGETPQMVAERLSTFNKSTGAFASGQDGKTVTAYNNFLQHSGVLRDLVGAMANGNVQLVNKAKNAFELAFGAPAPNSFAGVRDIVADEAVKAVLGGAGALGDRDALKSHLSGASSPQQLYDMLGDYQKLGAGQLYSLDTKYKKNTGLTDFDAMLTPDAKRIYEQYKQAGAGQGGGGNGQFKNGQIYKDANGNRARYDNGHWQPVP